MIILYKNLAFKFICIKVKMKKLYLFILFLINAYDGISHVETKNTIWGKKGDKQR